MKRKLLVLVLCCNSLLTVQAADLLEIYYQAVAEDPNLKTAEYQQAISNDRTGQALGEMLPQIQANLNWSLNKQENDLFGKDSYRGTRYFISLTQTIINFEKFWNWRRAAKTEQQQQTNYITAKQVLIFNVVERYFDVLYAKDRLSFYQSELKAIEKQLEQTKKQYSKKLLKITDLYEVEAHLDQINADLIEAEVQLHTAIESLKELTGTIDENFSELNSNITLKPIEGTIEEWLELAKNQNPDIQAQQIAIEAAKKNILQQQSRYFPVVEVQLNYYNTDTGFQSTRSPHSETQVAALNVSVPLFSSGITSNLVSEARHNLAIIQEENVTKTRALVKETRDAYFSANAFLNRIKAVKKAFRSSKKSTEAMNKSYKYGIATISDVLSSRRQELRTKMDLSQAKYDYIKNQVRFLKAVGSLDENNVMELNNFLRL